MSADPKRLAHEQLQQGTARHRAGELGLAQSHYQRAVKLDPQNADAWHLLGVASLQSGNAALAIKHLRKSVDVRPGFAEAHNNLGVALRGAARYDEAIAAFQNALSKRSAYVDAAFNLGIAFESAERPADAERAYRQALAWRSNHLDAAINLGNLLRRTGRAAEALPFLQLAQQLDPDRAQTNGNLSLVLSDLGRHAEAIGFAQRAVTLAPGQALWWKALGVAQRMRHDVESAIPSLRKAFELDADDGATLLDLSLALHEAGDSDESHALLERAVAPTGFAERVRWMRELSLPALYRDDADIAAWRERFTTGVEKLHADLKLDSSASIGEALHGASNVAPFHLHYQPHDNTQLQFRFGELVARVVAAAAPEMVEPCAWQPRLHGGRVRVGFVSSHLMNHTVSRYFSSLITGLDPKRFDVRVWYSGGIIDASTQSVTAAVGTFIHTRNDLLTDASAIRDAQLDVLVYLEIGMDPRHQALAAMRLAPVQCALYGHPATSGSAQIDYFISGDAMEPANAQAHYRERLLRLPGLGARPTLPPAPGDGSWIEEFQKGGPLLLCLQYFIKLMPSFDEIVARIAKETGARIGFFSRNPPLTQRFRARIEAAFQRAGADPLRHLVFMPVQTHSDFLAAIARVPLVLDSSHFSGGGTSLDSLHVGTPVVTWQGDMARGRQTSAMLHMMGIPELVTHDAAGYIQTCVELLSDDTRRAEIADRVRQRQSILFDDEAPLRAFADFLETAAPPD